MIPVAASPERKREKMRPRFSGPPLFSDVLFSAIVLMVIVTTLISPPLLKLALRSDAKADTQPDAR
jgi:Kef-type K+ transport system membrane component KefB